MRRSDAIAMSVKSRRQIAGLFNVNKEPRIIVKALSLQDGGGAYNDHTVAPKYTL